MISKETQSALQRLEENLAALPGVMVAFSGGMDSSFLGMAAHRFLKNRVTLLFCKTELISQAEADVVTAFGKRYGIPLTILTVEVLDQKALTDNPPDRCYHCKHFLFTRFLERVPPGWVLCEGTNLDDQKDFRPGKKALRELSVASPLEKAGFTKAMIREVLTEWGFPELIQLPKPCLATRIPCGTPLTRETLRLVEAGEIIIARTGIKGFRLRLHGDVGRIEVPPDELANAVAKLQTVTADLKKLGLRHVALDLEGYQQGSMNR